MALFRKKSTPQTVLDLRGAAPRTAADSRGSHGLGSPRSLRRFPRWLGWGWGVLGTTILVAAVAVAAPYLIHRFATPGSGQPGMQRAVAEVGRLMFLPTGETPTYGTVANKTKLSNQTFFKNAQNGDEVLIYEQAKLSILYRPSAHKIVNVGPLVVGNGGSPYISSRIAILNGSNNPGFTAAMTTRVTAAFPNATIVSKGAASRGYPTSFVADLTTKNQPLAEQMADSLGVQGGKLPLGEPAPDAEVLVLIGTDFK